MADLDRARLVGDIEAVGVRGLPYPQLHEELAARIRRAFAVDATCWHGLDPETRLMTTADPVELLGRGFLTPESEPDAARAVVASEYARDDVNQLSVLAGRRTPVAILSETTRGRPERSARYREFLEPIGTPYEMRVAMVTRGRAWGAVILHRTEQTGDFGGHEARLMAALSRPIAEAMRRSYRADAARRADYRQAPGLLVLGPDDDVELVTPPTAELLAGLTREDPIERQVPVPVRVLAAEVRRRGREGQAAQPMHVPTSDGWLTLHGSLPDGAHAGRVAVVVQRADQEYAVPLRLEAFGLSARERDVAGLVARGFDTAAIAERLVISPWTVQDHLKSIFDKTGTRSRRELLSAVFFHDQLPGIAARDPINAGGHLQTTAPADP